MPGTTGSLTVYVDLTQPWPGAANPEWAISAWRVEFPGFAMPLHPSYWYLSGRLQVQIPLWLLAVLCLAWPVTSSIVARRRRRLRGFEVQATGGSAVSVADS